MRNTQRIVSETVAPNGSCAVLIAKTSKHGNFGTWYVLETYAPNSSQPISREFSFTCEAFDALERWEKRHGIAQAK